MDRGGDRGGPFLILFFDNAPNKLQFRSAATGERTADLTSMHADESGNFLRTDSLNVTMTLSEDGETVHSDFGFLQQDATRMHVSTVRTA